MTRVQALRLAILVVFLVAWEGIARLGWVSPIILASPSEVAAAFVADGGRFMRGLLVTLAEIGAAVLLAWSLGIGFGLLAGSRPRLAAPAGPLLSSLFAVPVIILYPLLIAWVGLGSGSKILFGFVSGFFPIALNTLSGIRGVDQRFALMARAMGASRGQIYLRLNVRLALPAIISGLRIGTALVVIGVIVTEMLASLGGIGYLISYHRTLFDTGHVYLGMLLGLLVVVLVNWVLSGLERRFGRWRVLEATSG